MCGIVGYVGTQQFSGLGYKVFTIPEVPTMFTQAGMNMTWSTSFLSAWEKRQTKTD